MVPRSKSQFPRAFPVRFRGGRGPVLPRVVLDEEEAPDAVSPRHRLLRSHGDTGKNRAVLERDSSVVRLDGAGTLGLERVPAVRAHRRAGLESQSGQDSVDQTLWMGHRHGALANRRHVLPGK